MTELVALDPLELAWAAGLFEGEGCFSVNRRVGVGGLQLSATLSSTDEDVVRAFQSAVGIGTVLGPYSRKGRPNKPLWQWAVSGADVERVYALLSPWLHRRRCDRYAELLAERRAYQASLPAMYAERGRRSAATRRRTQLELSHPLRLVEPGA